MPYALFRAFQYGKNYVEICKQWLSLPPVAAILTILNVITIGYFNVGWTIAVIKLASRSITGKPLRKKL
jgi:hypothetical protein